MTPINNGISHHHGYASESPVTTNQCRQSSDDRSPVQTTIASAVIATANTQQKAVIVYQCQTITLKNNSNRLGNDIKENTNLISKIKSIRQSRIRITRNGKVKGYNKNITHAFRTLISADYRASIEKAKKLSENRNNKTRNVEAHLTNTNNCKKNIITDIDRNITYAAEKKHHNIFTNPYQQENTTIKQSEKLKK